jgi:hypothetical protein
MCILVLITVDKIIVEDLMARKFFIQDWDNFSKIEKEDFQELISVSLRAKELRLKLRNQSIDTIDKEFEVTGNPEDSLAKPIHKEIPRVASFMELRSNPSLLSLLSDSCEGGCERQFPNDPRKLEDCKNNCPNRINLIVERLLNSDFSIANLLEDVTEA